MPEYFQNQPSAGSAIQKYLLDQAARDRQAELDVLAKQKQQADLAREASAQAAQQKYYEALAANSAESTAGLKAQREQTAKDAEQKSVIEGLNITGLGGGVSPELTTRTNEAGLSGLLTPMAPAVVDTVKPEMDPAKQQGVYPGIIASSAPSISNSGPATASTFRGSPTQQKDKAIADAEKQLGMDLQAGMDPDQAAIKAISAGMPWQSVKPISDTFKKPVMKATIFYNSKTGGDLKIRGVDGQLRAVTAADNAVLASDGVEYKPYGETANGAGSEPSWGIQVAPDGSVWRYNTKDPNLPMVAQTMPGGAQAKHVTGQTQAMMEGANMLLPHVGEIDTLAKQLDERGMFGPFASRMREIMTKFGTVSPLASDAEQQSRMDQLAAEIANDPVLNSDELAGRFSTELSLLASGLGRVHGGARGGGSIQMIDYLKSMTTANATYAMFHGKMSGVTSFLDGYAKGPNNEAAPVGAGKTPYQQALDRQKAKAKK